MALSRRSDARSRSFPTTWATLVTGTCNGLPEGAVVDIDGSYFQVSYVGGGSQADVTLTVVPQPVAVWTGTAGDNNWNTAANWQGHAVPAPGQSVDFPDLGASDGTINLATNVTGRNLTFDGDNYTIAGHDSITVDGDVAANNGSAAISSNLLLGHDTTITVAGSLLDVSGTVSDGGNEYGITEP
jgi:hypothetical protein